MRLIILMIFAILLGSCSTSWKKAEEISPIELLKIHAVHTTNHTVYCGSDSLYHYYKQATLFKKDKAYKVKKVSDLPYEFPIDEKRDPILF